MSFLLIVTRKKENGKTLLVSRPCTVSRAKYLSLVFPLDRDTFVPLFLLVSYFPPPGNSYNHARRSSWTRASIKPAFTMPRDKLLRAFSFCLSTMLYTHYSLSPRSLHEIGCFLWIFIHGIYLKRLINKILFNTFRYLYFNRFQYFTYIAKWKETLTRE